MDETISFGEQLSLIEHDAQVGETDSHFSVQNSDENEGSSYGKFKSADSLFTAYNHLQAEFTKKCQRLNELEKQISDNADIESKSDEDSTPIYKRENWNEIVSTFLEKNEDAKKYSKDICQEIMKEPSQYYDENSVAKAYSKVLARQATPPNILVEDERFLKDYIFTNDSIKKQLLSIYLDELSKQKTPPIISSTGSALLKTEKPSPTNIKEAGDLAKKILNG